MFKWRARLEKAAHFDREGPRLRKRLFPRSYPHETRVGVSECKLNTLEASIHNMPRFCPSSQSSYETSHPSGSPRLAFDTKSIVRLLMDSRPPFRNSWHWIGRPHGRLFYWDNSFSLSLSLPQMDLTPIAVSRVGMKPPSVELA